MAKRAKTRCTYQDSSDDGVEILGITQGSSAPGILQSTALSRPSKRSAAASSLRRHRYKCRDYINAEDDNEAPLPWLTKMTVILVILKL